MMLGQRGYVGRKSAWRRTGPSARLVAGALVICVVGLAGLTPKHVLGIEVVWPYAALWASVGWASAGFALRPMLILAAFGIAQDVTFNAPLGSFMIVNLVTYGVAAALSESFDVDGDAGRALMVAVAAMAVGMAAVWALASTAADHAVRVSPLLAVYGMTLLLFIPLSGLFRLGGRPGEKAGALA